MDRRKMVTFAYGRSFFLNTRNNDYVKSIESFFKHFVKEDLGKGDITTDTLVSKRMATARITSKDTGILAGGEEFRWLCQNNGLRVRQFKSDGEKFAKGEKLFEVSGNQRHLFYLERTGLNLLQRMSGIATQTNEIVEEIKKAGLAAGITATRKTHWGYLDKKAVTVGGGLSHRLALHESFLIKDNHLQSMRKSGIKKPIDNALGKAWKMRDKSVFIEIEVKSQKEAVEAARKFKKLAEKTEDKKPLIIMLDNMGISDIRETIETLRESGLHDHVLIEVSGGLNKENILQYARTGADVFSLGSLTHSVKSLDITQDIV